MTLDLTRRSLLKFMGGAVAGAVLSPLPWKLLDDASIWTQNWSRIARPPRGVTHVVLDTAAQIGGKRLSEVVRVADRIVVPLQPSMFDVMATQQFLQELRAVFGNDRRFQDTVGIVGMRVDTRTRAAEELARFVAGVGLPVAGYVRDTQNYVQLAAHGLTVFDVPSQRVDKDRATWESLLQWLGR